MCERDKLQNLLLLKQGQQLCCGSNTTVCTFVFSNVLQKAPPKTKYASTGPNKFNIQYHYAPEISIEPTAFAVFSSRKTWYDS